MDISLVTKILVDITAKHIQFLPTVTVATERNNLQLLLKVLSFLSTESMEQVEASASALTSVGINLTSKDYKLFNK